MKKLLVVSMLVLAAFVAGCGVGDTAPERARRIIQISNMHWRMAVEDWDYFWLVDKNSQLSSWHPRIGF